jgi:hypothetical protein
LAGLLSKVLDEYTKAHPATTNAEVRAAVRMAQASVGRGSSAVAAMVSVGLGLVVAGLLAAFLFFRGAGEGGGDGTAIGPILPMIIMFFIIFLGVMMIAMKRRL